jgi:hypothetical protein
MSQETIHLPEFDTYEDLMDRIQETDIKIDEEAAALLGQVNDKSKARGRALLMADALRAHPDGSFYTVIPVADMQVGPKEHPLTREQRMHALAVNERLLQQLYQEAGVKFDNRQEEAIDHGHGNTLKEVIYPTDKGYAFVEQWTFGYKDDPKNSLPVKLEVFAYTLRNGELTGAQFISEHSEITGQ